MTPQAKMRSLLQRIATGPELSKDISLEEACSGMELILQGEANPVQAGLFLIALRMKRETNDELLGIQQALLKVTKHTEVGVDDLVEISDPFNGYVRGLSVVSFLAPLLAACGVPAICHGVETVGPKYGVTHHNVLDAAGVDVGLALPDAVARISDPKIGWAYVDQRMTCPSLYQLIGLRDLMVKRTCLTTIEVALHPIRAKKRTHLLTGYVHKPYPPIYTMLARNAGYHSAMVVRGVEGGVVPSLQQPSKLHCYYDGQSDEELRIEPSMVGIEHGSHRALPIPEKAIVADEEVDINRAAAAAAQAGISALHGEPGLAYDSLVYSGALVLSHLKHGSVDDCASRIREALDSGAVADRFSAKK
ncbi:MAG: hypothetical protein QNI91_18725 [Arenicellales bacterium]|nr:hypothetical protein [Arenicellales bacterium]